MCEKKLKCRDCILLEWHGEETGWECPYLSMPPCDDPDEWPRLRDEDSITMDGSTPMDGSMSMDC